ncbi:MAG: DNA modification methylase [Candidatus Paceibacterota bacterium]|jgi:DNA modification methylase
MMNKNLNIVYVPIGELRKAEYNPRKWSVEQKKQLKESITRFGVVDPILVNSAKDRMNVVLGGHFRKEVLEELGHKEVPCIYINIPDLKREQELNIRLNKNQGEFDLDLLSEFNQEFLSDIGFDNSDLEEIFPDDTDTFDDEFDVEKELEKIKKPVSKLGDKYRLGNHTLVCGDSTDLNAVKNLVGDVKIDLFYLDPIYNINLSYKSGIGGSKNYGGSVTDNKTDKEYEEFLKKVLRNAVEVSSGSAHFFMYCDHSYVPLVANLYKEVGIDFKRTCIWLKGIFNPTPQIAFSKVYEPCVYGTIKKPYLSPYHQNFDEVLNKEVGTGNQMIEDVTDMFDIWLVKRLDGQSYNHPTEKPVTLHYKPFKRCSKKGDNILSLFGGSGGDLIAAEQLGRVCYMMELDPVFVDLIIRRYERATGNKAVKIT